MPIGGPDCMPFDSHALSGRRVVPRYPNSSNAPVSHFQGGTPGLPTAGMAQDASWCGAKTQMMIAITTTISQPSAGQKAVCHH
jgi:hypothetical protein